jgi:membrane protein DedA with SNARE-associated domain
MTYLFNLLEQYGLILVFANVLLEQGGLPLPAYPTLVITGALLDRGQYSAPLLLLTAVCASLIADFAWFMAAGSMAARSPPRYAGFPCRRIHACGKRK